MLEIWMKSVFKLLLATAFVIAGAACAQAESTEPPVAAATLANFDSEFVDTSTVAVADQPLPDPAPAEAADAIPQTESPAAPVAVPEAADIAAPASPSEPSADADPSIYSGIYTAAQAARGEQVQAKNCSVCHAPDDWAQGGLLTGFTGHSVFDFVESLRATMPMDGPGRLSYQEYVDITAFIFKINDVPAGSDELTTDEAELANVRVEFRR
jgi:hypothetical protein